MGPPPVLVIQRELLKPGKAGAVASEERESVRPGVYRGEVADALPGDDIDVGPFARAVHDGLSIVCGMGERQPGNGEERDAFGGVSIASTPLMASCRRSLSRAFTPITRKAACTRAVLFTRDTLRSPSSRSRKGTMQSGWNW